MKSPEQRRMRRTASRKPANIPLSLHPLSFDEAVTDILKAKPEPKATKKKTARQRNANER